MSSSICPHFTQNAWKKDLCSNCFKSKDEHKPGSQNMAKARFTAVNTTASNNTAAATATATSGGKQSPNATDNNNKKTDYPNKHKKPVKSIIKKSLTTSSSMKAVTTNNGKNKSQQKVCFLKQLSEVIGYGGEWSDDSFDEDNDDCEDDDFMNLGNEQGDDGVTGNSDDEQSLELKRITRANTDFNMNNGNLLGDPQENIKRSFAALKLGAPQMDKEGKKQTLKINVVPFGAAENAVKSTTTTNTSTTNSTTKNTVKTKFDTTTTNTTTSSTSTTTTTNNNNKNNNNNVKQITINKLPKTTTTTSSSTTTINKNNKNISTSTAIKDSDK